MKTLVVANQKGGVGKTAIAVHLAFDFIERSYRVAFVDLDTQGNASGTLAAFSSDINARAMFGDDTVDELIAVDGMALIKADSAIADIQAAPVDAATPILQARLADIAAQGFDICIIDTGPALATPLIAALRSATHVLSPIELETYSAQGIGKMLNLMAGAIVHNPGVKMIGVVASRVNRRSQRQTETLAALMQHFPTIMLPMTIAARDAIAQSATDKAPVWQVRKSSARAAALEMRALAKYVIEQINPSKEA